MELLVDLTYTCAKEAIAFAKFGPLCESQKRAGVQLGETYVNDRAAKEFTMTIGDELAEQLKCELAASDFVSVLVDGSTDCSVIEKELSYIRFVNADGLVCTKLMALKDVQHANSSGLLCVLKESLERVGISDYDKKLIGFMSDGASVNFGSKTGLLTKLKQDEQMPWIVGIHCLNHRLELAVKDAFARTAFSQICVLLTNIHSVFERSPKRLRALHDLAEIMGEEVRKPARSNGTRWVQHKVNAAKILLKQYGLIISALANITDDPQIKGYLKQMNTLKTLALLHLFVQVLAPIGKLSEYLQGDATNLLFAQSAVEAALATLANLTKASYGEELDKLVLAAQAKLAESETGIEFQSVCIYGLKDGIDVVNSTAPDIAKKLSKHITSRFSDILSESSFLVRALTVLDISVWPETKDELYEFGKAEVTSILQHFAEVLREKVDSSEVMGEWLQLKIYISSHMRHLPAERCWSVLSTGKAFPNVIKVINLLRVFPVSNAVVERCFSTMTKVKTDWRNRLGEEEVECLIRIKKEGPVPGTDAAKALVKAAAMRFLKAKPRRGGSSKEKDHSSE